MAQTIGINPEEFRVREGEYPEPETPLETAWTFWYDKKTSDRKESDQYMEGLRQLGSFNTVEGFFRHYSFLLRPSELPRDHNVLLFRKGYKPMWEEFPEGGCWIIRIKRKVSQGYVNRMWENLLLACVGEAFEMPDVVGCVLSTRSKDDVLSIWNLNNRVTQARFRIGEKLKEVLDLDMNALIQYKDHMQSLHDYSTYRNAKNYMFAPSPNMTPLQGGMGTPQRGGLGTPQRAVLDPPGDIAFDMLPEAAIDTVLPAAAVDSEGPLQGCDDTTPSRARSGSSSWNVGGPSPALSAAAAPWSPQKALGTGAGGPLGDQLTKVLGSMAGSSGRSTGLSPSAEPWYPPGATAPAAAEPAAAAAAVAAESAAAESTAEGVSDDAKKPEAAPPDKGASPAKKSWAEIAGSKSKAPAK